ncbi:lipid droplet-associated hydrolase isoform X2 [Olea europaea subsp. europaea]|uniref:Lipid droplet-associated hydrolase isoform X2 n=1 Tax=Olea europaea subsp. europaea TaxID=158383 RepID=A0A8S0QMD7_OLEEU|nr:lipid droplet-associated hydrolase isoform X2 [Olea europaea subsp. europaea]
MNSVIRTVLSPTATSLISSLSFQSRRVFSTSCADFQMGRDNLSLIDKTKHAKVRLCNVTGYKTDLLEIPARDPSLHVVFIPGNPGVISFYTDFLESLFELLGGTASVTAIGHISHSEKDWENGRLFSLQEQIDHKASFIEHEFQDVEVPIILVGHSIGAYISLEIFRRSQEKVIYYIGLYPFLAVNTVSSAQSFIRRFAGSQFLCAALGSIGGLLGKLPTQISGFVVKNSIGKSWSSSAVVSFCTSVLQYHTIRNMLFMAMSEFQKLSEKPDWAFMGEKKGQIAFLFSDDDHWGPLHLYEEIRKQIPNARVAVEREGNTHAFSCSDAGSLWVAQHVASLIKNCISNSNL